MRAGRPPGVRDDRLHVRERARGGALAEEIPGPSTEALAGACARHGLHCVAGLWSATAIVSGTLRCSSGPMGSSAATARPICPSSASTASSSRRGAGQVYDTPVGRLGIVICYELRFPEPTRALALSGAELVLHPTNWPTAVRPFADFLTRARAAENRIFLLTANRVGAEGSVEFFGRSQVVDLLGNRLVEAGEREEELVVAEIEPAEARDKHRAIVPGEYEVDLFDDRRPELYGALVEETRPVHAH